MRLEIAIYFNLHNLTLETDATSIDPFSPKINYDYPPLVQQLKLTQYNLNRYQLSIQRTTQASHDTSQQLTQSRFQHSTQSINIIDTSNLLTWVVRHRMPSDNKSKSLVSNVACR